MYQLTQKYLTSSCHNSQIVRFVSISKQELIFPLNLKPPITQFNEQKSAQINQYPISAFYFVIAKNMKHFAIKI